MNAGSQPYLNSINGAQNDDSCVFITAVKVKAAGEEEGCLCYRIRVSGGDKHVDNVNHYQVKHQEKHINDI